MITIYSKDSCTYCYKAKEFLTSLGIAYTEIDLTDKQDEIMSLSQMSGFRTLPQIFIWEVKKEHLIGGYSDLLKLHESGELEAKMNQ